MGAGAYLAETASIADVAMLDVSAAANEAAILAALDRRSIVLVGMMGAGKSSVGRRRAGGGRRRW